MTTNAPNDLFRNWLDVYQNGGWSRGSEGGELGSAEGLAEYELAKAAFAAGKSSSAATEARLVQERDGWKLRAEAIQHDHGVSVDAAAVLLDALTKAEAKLTETKQDCAMYYKNLMRVQAHLAFSTNEVAEARTAIDTITKEREIYKARWLSCVTPEEG